MTLSSGQDRSQSHREAQKAVVTEQTGHHIATVRCMAEGDVRMGNISALPKTLEMKLLLLVTLLRTRQRNTL